MLYHVQYGFPPRFQAPVGAFKLCYSVHARRAAETDRYGDLTRLLPATLDTDAALLVEVETDARGLAVKLLYRLPRGRLDLVLAVSTDKCRWTVKTVWANQHDDYHKTLDGRRYAQAA